MTNENKDDEFESTDAAFEDTAGDDQEPASVQFTETRDDEMERLRQTAESADKRVLMAQAEAENFRKRMRRDFEDQLKFAAAPLVNDILQVRDNLYRAMESAGDDPAVAGLKDGVAIVAKQLDDTMAKYSIREIPALGELFDPNFHEAISQMPSPDHAEGMIAHVAATGFQMHDRVIRPSQVIVSTGPAS
ncbi:MAG: nucleotide exchange factor GrpE [Rubripirellula sp.]